MAETAYIDKYKVYEEACAGCWYHGDEVGSCNLSEPCEKLVIAFASAPAADVVEVVRCKDCKHGELYERNDGETGVYCNCSNSIFKYANEHTFTPVRDVDDFCSYGLRKKEVQCIARAAGR